MNKNLKRISVSVDEDDYQELKDLSRAGLSIGFLGELIKELEKKYEQ